MNENEFSKIYYQISRRRGIGDCFWCGKYDRSENHSGEKCKEEFKEAIQNLFNGKKSLSKKEVIKMRYSKR